MKDGELSGIYLKTNKYLLWRSEVVANLKTDHFDFEVPNGPVDVNAIREYRETLSGEIPKSFLEFLQTWNGVITPFGKFGQFDLTEDDDDEYGAVKILYGLFDASSHKDLRNASNGYRFKDRVPNTYTAIGADNSWNQICLNLEDGTVWQWYPGEPWEPSDIYEPTTEFLRPVAPSFDQFWNALVEVDEADFCP